jgi:hypothetical protein
LKQKQEILRAEMENNNFLLDIEHQKMLIGANSDNDIKPNSKFKNFNDLLSNLTKTRNITTKYPIISVTISHDNMYAVTVTCKDETTFFIKIYSLNTYSIVFDEVIGG